MMTSFVESMQLQTFWEWAGSNEQMWHVLWSRTPFEDRVLDRKMLKHVMMVKENINLHMSSMSHKSLPYLVHVSYYLECPP